MQHVWLITVDRAKSNKHFLLQIQISSLKHVSPTEACLCDIQILVQSTIPFCLIEVRAMVVAVQLPSAECTAIFTMCIV